MYAVQVEQGVVYGHRRGFLVLVNAEPVSSAFRAAVAAVPLSPADSVKSGTDGVTGN